MATVNLHNTDGTVYGAAEFNPTSTRFAMDIQELMASFAYADEQAAALGRVTDRAKRKDARKQAEAALAEAAADFSALFGLDLGAYLTQNDDDMAGVLDFLADATSASNEKLQSKHALIQAAKR